MASFRLKIITPDKVFYDDDTDMIVISTSEGQMGILANHENFVGTFNPGPLKIRVNGEIRMAAIASGFVKVSKDRTTIVTNAAEWADEIDLERAKASLENAQKVIKKNDSKRNIDFAEAKLKRALNRISISSKQ